MTSRLYCKDIFRIEMNYRLHSVMCIRVKILCYAFCASYASVGMKDVRAETILSSFAFSVNSLKSVWFTIIARYALGGNWKSCS